MSHFYKGEHFRNNQNSWNFMNKGMMIGYSPFLGNGGGGWSFRSGGKIEHIS